MRRPPLSFGSVRRNAKQPSKSPAPSDYPRALTPYQAAEILQVHVKTVRRWLRDIRLPLKAIKVGSAWRIPRDQFLLWMAEREEGERFGG